MKIAFTYDRITKWGGAERVLLALHKLYPNAPFYTAFYNPKTASWAKDLKVIPSFLNYFPFAKTHHELFALLSPFAFLFFNFKRYDLVISITSADAKNLFLIKPKTSPFHFCYCLTPTRYLWSHQTFYQQDGLKGFFLKMFTPILKSIDYFFSQNVNQYIAISKEVQGRIKKYYHRDSSLIYPPLTQLQKTKIISHDPSQIQKKSYLHFAKYQILNTEYYLVVSRLVPYKNIDLAIKACNKLKKKLIIIGTGSQKKYLQSISGPTIHFLGNLTDTDLAKYYMHCKCLIFPSWEDFGITPVEAQFYGKPVISLAKGGALETIIDSQTGVFFEKPDVTSLIKAIKKMENLKFDSKTCQINATKFSKEIFSNQFTHTITKFINDKKN